MRKLVLNKQDFSKLSEGILRQGGFLRFEALGSSMSPFIQGGDVLIIQPAGAAVLNLGDVAFYRRTTDGSLIAHRVVSKSVHGSRVMLTMRGDAEFWTNELVQAEQVLGRVVIVQRGRKIIHLNRGYRRLTAILWINLQHFVRLLFRLAAMIRRIASRLLRRL